MNVVEKDGVFAFTHLLVVKKKQVSHKKCVDACMLYMSLRIRVYSCKSTRSPCKKCNYHKHITIQRYNFSTLSGTWTTTRIQGLPYTQGNQNSQQYTPVHIGYLSNFYSGFPTTNNNFPGGYIRTGQSDLVLTINNPNGAETTISNSVLSSSTSGGIMFSAYYRDSASG